MVNIFLRIHLLVNQVINAFRFTELRIVAKSKRIHSAFELEIQPPHLNSLLVYARYLVS